MKYRSSVVRMHPRKIKQDRKNLAPPVCPYCGQRSVLRPATYVYGEDTIDRNSFLYVCSGYPSCDAYVGVHEGTKKPKGVLANSELRNKRIRAHRVLNEIVRTGQMTKDGVYLWLSSRLNIPYQEMHIGHFSDYLCEQTIKECEYVLKNWRENQKKYAA